MLADEPTNAPEVITLSVEADKLLEQFAEVLEPKLKTEYSDIADWAGKLVGSVARISGLLCRASVYRTEEFLEEPEPLVVSGEVMKNAISIGRYLIDHAKAAFSLMGADDGIKKCKYVLDAIVKSGLVEFTRRDVMRLCRSLKTVWRNWTGCSSVFTRIWSTENCPKLVFRCCLMIMSRSRQT